MRYVLFLLLSLLSLNSPNAQCETARYYKKLLNDGCKKNDLLAIQTAYAKGAQFSWLDEKCLLDAIYFENIPLLESLFFGLRNTFENRYFLKQVFGEKLTLAFSIKKRLWKFWEFLIPLFDENPALKVAAEEDSFWSAASPGSIQPKDHFSLELARAFPRHESVNPRARSIYLDIMYFRIKLGFPLDERGLSEQEDQEYKGYTAYEAAYDSLDTVYRESLTNEFLSDLEQSIQSQLDPGAAFIVSDYLFPRS